MRPGMAIDKGQEQVSYTPMEADTQGVHPRVGGEQPPDHGPARASKRFIPALAGNNTSARLRRSHSWVHPRVGGEQARRPQLMEILRLFGRPPPSRAARTLRQAPTDGKRTRIPSGSLVKTRPQQISFQWPDSVDSVPPRSFATYFSIEIFWAGASAFTNNSEAIL